MTEVEEKELRIKKYAVLASLLTPIVIALVGFFVQGALNEQKQELAEALKSQEQAWQARQSQLERLWKTSERVTSTKERIYQTLGADLNRIYVYGDDVGDFRRFTPQQIIDLKRTSDRTFYMYQSLWSTDVKKAYEDFMRAAFKTYQGLGEHPRIWGTSNEKIAAYRHDGLEWYSDWEKYFSGQKNPDLRAVYLRMVTAFMTDHVSNFAIQKLDKD